MTSDELLQLAQRYATELMEELSLDIDDEMQSLLNDIYINGFLQGATLILNARISKEFK